MLKKAVFYDFFNRRSDCDFDQFMSESVEDEHYIDWNGYVLPMHYGDAEFEYNAIRNTCAIYDGTPFRKIRIHGSGAGEFLDQLVTRRVSGLMPMQSAYVVFCNEDGTLKDDSVLFKFDENDYLIMPSDVDHVPYFEELRDRLGTDGVEFTDLTFEMTGLAIQGPMSAAVVLEMGFEAAEHLKPFEVRDYEIDGHQYHLSRTGFTADLGYECWFSNSVAPFVQKQVDAVRSKLSIPIPGYGLSTVQATRLEGGFIVAGWDCATEIDPQPGFERTPYELGLGWLVDLDGASFTGRDALAEHKKNGHANALRSFTIDTSAVPDDGADLLDGDGPDATRVGIITCSHRSWGLNAMIGNASMKSQHAGLDRAWVNIDGDYHAVNLSRGPLFNPERRNEVPASVELDPGRL